MFFFGMESFGGMGGEARSFCKLIAKLSGGQLGEKVNYFYQRVSVRMQWIRAWQISTTLREFTSVEQPPLPQV